MLLRTPEMEMEALREFVSAPSKAHRGDRPVRLPFVVSLEFHRLFIANRWGWRRRWRGLPACRMEDCGPRNPQWIGR